jgi:hypothetical protein
MGGCVLRAWGDNFQPESFLAGSSLEPCNVFTKGARKSEGRTWDTSGLTVLVSDDSDNFKHQVTDAIEFLTSNRLELQRLKASVGIDGLSLDFGVSETNGFLQNHFFPPELISLAAEHALGLEVSIYAS